MLDIKNVPLQLDCPKCKHKNPFIFAQAEKGEKIKCAGCGVNIILRDNGSVARAQNNITKSFNELSEQINKINRRLKR